MDPGKLIFFLFVAILCAIGSAMVKDKKSYLLFLIGLFLPFRSGLIFYHLNGIILVDFPLFALFFWTLFDAKRLRLVPAYVGIPMLVFLSWSFLTSFTATNIGWGINQWTRFFRAYLAFVVILNNVNSNARLKFLLRGIFSGFGFQTLLGVFQWRYGPAGLWILEEEGIPWRAAGTFVHPAMFADYLAFFLPVLLRLFAFLPQKNAKTNVFYGVWFILGTAALFASYARGVWIGFAAAMMMTIFYSILNRKLKPRVKIAYLLLVCAASIFLLRYGPVVLAQFENRDRMRAAEIRIPLNYVALRMIRANAVLGVGPDNYRLAAPDYVVFDDTADGFGMESLSQIVHNSYLLLAAEMGIPGLLLFLWIITGVFYVGWKCVRSKNLIISNFSIGILSGMLANLIEYLSGPDLLDYQITMSFWLYSALILVLFRFKVQLEKQLVIERKRLHVSPIASG